MFVRAFTHGARDPSLRPTAAEWRAALSRIQLRSCERGTHQVPVSSMRCPWCTIDDEREMRKRQQAGSSAPTAAREVLQRNSIEPVLTAGSPAVQKAEPIPTTRVILVSLAGFVLIVAVLTTFIVWALLSGTSSFGVLAPPVSSVSAEI
jgi:eukaryotic-like serine/threonine-protein kinase